MRDTAIDGPLALGQRNTHAWLSRNSLRVIASPPFADAFSNDIAAAGLSQERSLLARRARAYSRVKCDVAFICSLPASGMRPAALLARLDWGSVSDDRRRQLVGFDAGVLTMRVVAIAQSVVQRRGQHQWEIA